MIEKRRSILFLSPYPKGSAASQRLKYEQYFDWFEQNGYDLKTSSFISPAFWRVLYAKGHFLRRIGYTIQGYLRRFTDLFTLRRYDIVYVHLWATPLGPPVYEWLVGSLARKLVYDIDDMGYHQQGSPVNRLVQLLKGRRKPIALMKYADHVVTCTDVTPES